MTKGERPQAHLPVHRRALRRMAADGIDLEGRPRGTGARQPDREFLRGPALPERADRTHELSGRERQRVALARAMVKETATKREGPTQSDRDRRVLRRNPGTSLGRRRRAPRSALECALWSSRCAPRGVQRMCCHSILLLTTSLMVDSTKALEIVSPLRWRSP